jgi:hypothetical protein
MRSSRKAVLMAMLDGFERRQAQRDHARVLARAERAKDACQPKARDVISELVAREIPHTVTRTGTEIVIDAGWMVFRFPIDK